MQLYIPLCTTCQFKHDMLCIRSCCITRITHASSNIIGDDLTRTAGEEQGKRSHMEGSKRLQAIRECLPLCVLCDSKEVRRSIQSYDLSLRIPLRKKP